MITALIVCAAPVPESRVYYRNLIASAGFVVAADAGALLCLESERVPDIIVGDLDSLPAEDRLRAESLGARLLTAPVEKDETDLDLALAVVLDSGFSEATVTAAWSGRLDHTLAATGSVASASGLIVDIIDPDMAAWVLDTRDRTDVLLAPRGSTVSLIALAEATVVSCTGMRYKLSRDTLDLLSSQGVSNYITEKTAEVKVHAGRLLVLTHTVAEAPLAELAGMPV